MAISIQCPECREKYQIENEHGGKALECKCGKNLDIPQAPADGGDIKECPFCKATTGLDAVICVGCGYNFSTGVKMKASAEAEEESAGEQGPSLAVKILPIVKFVVVPLVLIVVAFLIYRSLTGKHYGISKAAPLGVFDIIDKELTQKKLVKSADTKPIPKGFGVEGKIYTYGDEALKKASKGALDESISVAVDGQNRVVGFFGTFFPPGEAVPVAGSKVYLNMLLYWQDEMELPKKPNFENKQLGEGRASYSVNTATAQNEKVSAQWVKEPGPTALQASSDTMCFALKEYKVENLARSPEIDYLTESKEGKQSEGESGEAASGETSDAPKGPQGADDGGEE